MAIFQPLRISLRFFYHHCLRTETLFTVEEQTPKQTLWQCAPGAKILLDKLTTFTMLSGKTGCEQNSPEHMHCKSRTEGIQHFPFVVMQTRGSLRFLQRSLLDKEILSHDYLQHLKREFGFRLYCVRNLWYRTSGVSHHGKTLHCNFLFFVSRAGSCRLLTLTSIRHGC